MMRRMEGPAEPGAREAERAANAKEPREDEHDATVASPTATRAASVAATLHQRRRRKRLPLNSSLWALPLTMGVASLLLAALTGWSTRSSTTDA